MSDWILSAIEKEAMARALREVTSPEWTREHLRIIGLTVPQIMALAQFYEQTTGKRATEIDFVRAHGQ